MKTLEFIYPEYTNIYGEEYNVEYLSKCNKNINIIKTTHESTPYFVKNRPDMIYIGSMSEDKQEKTIKYLMKYKKRIKELIDDEVIFLVTGNSIELFGKYIKDGKRIINTLDLFDYYSERFMNDRHNSQYVGTFKCDEENITMLGHRSQFSFSYGNFDNSFIDISIGIGMNKETKKEGVHYKNFFATYSLGPYLILNPLFTKYLLRKLNLNDSLLFEEEALEAYEYRKKELIEKLK